jgi:putative transposase
MKFKPDIHHRKTIRLHEYDYSQAGFYFVTMCTQNRVLLFGDIVDGVMVLNGAGMMIETWWNELPQKFVDIRLDEYVVMPNHMHGVIEIVGADLRVCPDKNASINQGAHTGAPLHTMVQWFKTMTTNAYIQGVNKNNWPCFPGKLWQRNYWERIIRNDQELNNTREYIRNNPAQWALDDLYL